MIRTPLALIPYLLLCAFVVSGAIWHMADQESALLSGSGVVGAAIGGPFSLIDQDGAPRSDKDFRGRFALVYFGYTNCPDVCPTTLAMMADALDRLGAKSTRFTPIFITVDPARDTSKILKQYLAAFGPRFVGLTGSPSSIAAAEHEYRVYAAKHPLPGGGYAMDHSGEIYLLGPDGKLVAFYDTGIDSKMLAADLAKRI
jgi:cytochrome oxidase Cu insertion factor (SCO1/SenC/PrrC family)